MWSNLFACFHMKNDLYQGNQKKYEEDYCYCAAVKDLEHIGPYCNTWNGYPRWCMLNGGSDARYCPGATNIKGTNNYFTEDNGICNKSQGNFFIRLKFSQKKLIFYNIGCDYICVSWLSNFKFFRKRFCNKSEGMHNICLYSEGILCWYVRIKTYKIYYYINKISISLSKAFVLQAQVAFILL